MSYILAFLAAVIVFCGYLILDMRIAAKKRKELLRERLAPDGSAMGMNPDEAPVGLNGEASPRAQSILTLLRFMGVNTEEASRQLDMRFAQAGVSSPDAPAYYLFFQRIGGLFFLFLALVLFSSASGSDNKLLIYTLGLICAVIGLFGPKLYLQNMIDKRKKILQRSFPDTLDLLLICVESGLALDAALTRVCNELGRAYPEMTAELNRTRLELALINDRVRALMNLGDRTGMVAFRSLIAALIQSERFGTSLTDTLRVLSEEFRLQRLTEAEAKAARLPVLMTIPLIFFLMPALFLIVLGPAIVKINNQGQAITGK
ncbi:MAG: type II secretion system F family protein [Rickettsiales bacterium]